MVAARVSLIAVRRRSLHRTSAAIRTRTLQQPQASPGIVVIGASAGGVEALKRVCADLPPSIRAAVLVVLHVSPTSTSVMPSILARAGANPAVHVEYPLPLRCGRIYVAPPNRHIIIEPGSVAPSAGPRENGHRPSIDVLFRTAAMQYGPAVIGVILSGNLDDGAKGVEYVKEHGGFVIVQDPHDALYPAMPTNALASVEADRVVPIEGIADAIVEALARRSDGATDFCAGLESGAFDVDARLDPSELRPVLPGQDTAARDVMEELRSARPSVFSCPDCGGVLMEIDDGRLVHYRCRVGHAWNPESLLTEKGNSIERALWTALRALEERAQLSGRVAETAHGRGNDVVADRFMSQARQALDEASVIRDLLYREISELPETPESLDPPPGTPAGGAAGEDRVLGTDRPDSGNGGNGVGNSGFGESGPGNANGNVANNGAGNDAGNGAADEEGDAGDPDL